MVGEQELVVVQEQQLVCKKKTRMKSAVNDTQSL